MPHLDQSRAERLAKILAQSTLATLGARLRELRDLDGLCPNCLAQLELATLGTMLADAAIRTLGAKDGAVYCAEVAAMVAEHDEPAPQPH